MLRRSNDPVTNAILLNAANIDISFKAHMTVLDGKCIRIAVKMHDKDTNKDVLVEYHNEEAELMFNMLAKPAMRLGYIVHREV